MLTLDIRPILKLRGINNPYTFLVKMGFVPRTAVAWTNGDVGYIRPEQVEKLCVALNCTPNDLFHHTPSSKSPLADNHALNALIRTGSAPDITQLLRNLPPDRLSDLAASLTESGQNRER